MKKLKMYVIYDTMTETIITCFGADSEERAEQNTVRLMKSYGVSDDTPLSGVELGLISSGFIGDDCSILMPTKFSELSNDFNLIKIRDVREVLDSFKG